MSGVRIEGRPAYIDRRAFIDDYQGRFITLCDGCVISLGVIVLAHDFAVSRVLRARGDNSCLDAVVLDAVVVGQSAFIGAGSIIMPGVTVGRGAIVGAGSVVTRDVLPDTVVAGNPARPICDVNTYLERLKARHPEAFVDEGHAAWLADYTWDVIADKCDTR